MNEADIARLGPKAQQQILRKLLAAAVASESEQSKKRSKYGNQKATIEGIKFDSKKEAQRYVMLISMQQSGHISDLRLQVDFTLQEAYTKPDGERVRAIRYKADFTYIENGQLIVEDVKSAATRKDKTYRMKNKMMADRYGITIREF